MMGRYGLLLLLSLEGDDVVSLPSLSNNVQLALVNNDDVSRTNPPSTTQNMIPMMHSTIVVPIEQQQMVTTE